ncbi:hypothetical protein Pint_14315 [Pistacia integerrima]|uniref:Uncharacterized protein n=1 Tax=Pistacia integerrima TaxID=434235 RepID=A0ACC0Y5Z5_9ROSI|nr:hypothetical protein Pint_14315 [Pistacia integerrima]
MASDAAMEKMQLRQSYQNMWHTDLLGSIKKDTPFMCYRNCRAPVGQDAEGKQNMSYGLSFSWRGWFSGQKTQNHIIYKFSSETVQLIDSKCCLTLSHLPVEMLVGRNLLVAEHQMS